MSELDFSKWLEKKMQERKMDRYDLAKAAGISPQMVTYYLNGRSEPNMRTLPVILEVFQAHIEIVDNEGAVL